MHAVDLNRDRFISNLFDAIDDKDADAFASFIAADGSFTFGNWPTATGTAAIKGAAEQFFQSVHKIRHSVQSTWTTDGMMFVEGNVTYIRKDGKTVGPLPFMNRFQMSGDKVRDYRVFADVSALFQ